MKWMKVIIIFVILSGCAHINNKNEPLSDLGVVIIDYDDEYLEMKINDIKVLDEKVYSDGFGAAISTSFVLKAPRRLQIDFCVEGDCVKREFLRSKKDHYLVVSPTGPIATHPPYMELSHDLDGLD